MTHDDLVILAQVGKVPGSSATDIRLALRMPVAQDPNIRDALRAAHLAGLVTKTPGGTRSNPHLWTLTELGVAWVRQAEQARGARLPPPRDDPRYLTEAEWDVLDTLAAGPAETKAIVEDTGRSSSTVDKVRLHLERRGLVRQVGGVPRRVVWGLTPKGIEAQSQNPLARRRP